MQMDGFLTLKGGNVELVGAPQPRLAAVPPHG